MVNNKGEMKVLLADLWFGDAGYAGRIAWFWGFC